MCQVYPTNLVYWHLSKRCNYIQKLNFKKCHLHIKKALLDFVNKKLKHFFFTFIKTAPLVCTMRMQVMPRPASSFVPGNLVCWTLIVVSALQQGTLHLPPMPGTSQTPTGWLQHIPGKAAVLRNPTGAGQSNPHQGWVLDPAGAGGMATKSSWELGWEHHCLFSELWNKIKGDNFISNTSKEKGVQRLNQK